MRKSFSERIIAGMEEVLSDIKKTKEAMQESGDDKFVDEKRLQKKVIPNGTRNDKEPADTPLEVDELSYSKKKKDKAGQAQQPLRLDLTDDANTAEVKMSENKKSKSRIELIQNAWKENKAAEEKDEKYDINRIEKMKVTRADNESSPEEVVERAVNMGVSSLRSTAKLLMELLNVLDEDNAYCLAQPWIQNKIALANDYVLSIHDYIMFHDEYADDEDDEQEPQEMSKAPVADAYYGNFDGHDGHSYSETRFGGKKRSDLKDSDFLFPEDRSFPIVVPKDVKDAVRNFGRTNKNISYDAFIKKLYNKAKNKGPEFVAAIPKATKDKLGLKKDQADYEGGNF
jgi:hypothetical protein